MEACAICSTSAEGQYHHSSSCGASPTIICSRLRRIFKGPPKPVSQPQYRDEKPYKHVPVHAASSFMASTTTAPMIDKIVTDHYEPGRDAKESVAEDIIKERDYRRAQGSLI